MMFVLRQANNGGWVVTSDDAPHLIPMTIGAYTDTQDALAGLAKLMAEKDVTRKETPDAE